VSRNQRYRKIKSGSFFGSQGTIEIESAFQVRYKCNSRTMVTYPKQCGENTVKQIKLLLKPYVSNLRDWDCGVKSPVICTLSLLLTYLLDNNVISTDRPKSEYNRRTRTENQHLQLLWSTAANALLSRR